MNVTVDNEYSEVSSCHPDTYCNAAEFIFFLEMILVLWNIRKKKKLIVQTQDVGIHGFPMFVEECCIWRVYICRDLIMYSSIHILQHDTQKYNLVAS